MSKIKVICLYKNRDNKGNVIDYVLKDEKGQEVVFTKDNIKDMMHTGKYDFVNLQIDKAGRLVDRAVKKDIKQKNESKPNAKEIVKQWFREDASRYYDNFYDYDDNLFVRDYDHNCLPVAVKKFFDKYIKDLQDLMEKDMVSQFCEGEGTVNDEYRARCSSLPDSVVKLFNNTKMPFNIIAGLCDIASRKNNIGVYRFYSYNTVNGGWGYTYFSKDKKKLENAINSDIASLSEIYDPDEWTFSEFLEAYASMHGNEIGWRIFDSIMQKEYNIKLYRGDRLNTYIA